MADAAAVPRLPASGLRGWWRSPAMRRFRRHPGSWVGGGIVLVLVLVALFAPYLADRPPNAQNLRARLQPPSLEHPFGTDEFGRSVYSRVLHGTRVSLLTGLVPVLVALTIGSTIGLVAGYVRGRLDGVLMRVMDVLLALPGILLAIAIVAALGPNIVNAMVAIAIVRIPTMARVVRSDVLAVKTEEFVEAAKALGQSHLIVLFKHILINAWAPALVLATLGMGTAIVAEAALSFLGLGTQPPQVSWGRMLSVGREAIRSAPHVTLYPGLAITIVVLGFSLLGDGLRDVFDRRLKDT